MAGGKQPVAAAEAVATSNKKKKQGGGACNNAGTSTTPNAKEGKGKGKQGSSSSSSSSSASATTTAADAAGSGGKRCRTQEDEKEGLNEDGSSPTKPQEAEKKKKKKGSKKKQGGAEKGPLSHSLMEVLGNTNFFVQAFVEEGWLPKMRDIIALGSSCKALAPLRAPWDSLSIDLKQAQKTLRYPNRWLRRLASPACAGLKCLSIARPVTAEMNHELANAFQSGNLSNLQELTLSNYSDRELHAFKPLLLATNTDLLHNLRLLFLDRYRVGGKGWDLLDQVLKKEKAVEKKKGKATGSILSKRMLIESVRVQSSLASLESLNLRETSIRTATLENWIKTLERHKSCLQELSIIGNKQKSVEYLAMSISSGAFPALRILYLDEIALTSQVAARIVDGLAKNCHGLEVLVLGNSHGSRWDMRNSASTGTELVDALCRAAVGGPVHGDGLRSLQTLVLAWVGLSKEAVKGLTGCLFGGKPDGGGGLMHTLQTMAKSLVGLGDAKQGFHLASELPDATSSSSAPVLRRDEHYFPALESFGLTQQSNTRDGSPLLQSLPFLKRLLRACVARGITDVDLSRNGLRAVNVVEMIQFLQEDLAIARCLRDLPSDLKLSVDLTQLVKSHDYSYPTWEKSKLEVDNFVNIIRRSVPACVNKTVVVEWGQTQLNK